MNFYFTFGQKYHREPHPCGGHPDGWFRVVSDSMENARLKMVEECGMQWSHAYSEDYFESTKHYYPRGELKVIE